jgi:hypothetical protein
MPHLAHLQRALIRNLISASLATFVGAAAIEAACSQSPLPQAAPKSVIIQVEPAPNPIAPPAQPMLPVAPDPIPPRENPGLINEIGKLFKTPSWTIPSLPALKSPFETIDDLNSHAKNATDALPRLNTVVKGRVACPTAANGAPDCKTASDRLCQRNGFKEGKSLDTDAAQSCSAQSMLPGRKREEGDCKTENYVIRALCQ